MKAKRKATTKAKRDETDPHAEFHRKFGRALCAQEDEISDLLSMARISRNIAFAVGETTGGDSDQKGDLIFASEKLLDMVEEFRRQWYERHKEAQSKTEAAS